MAEGTQRRLAAIVSADVVGYSRLMGEDEAGTLEALRHFRNELLEPAVAEHHGQVVKNMGDGWLLAFDSAADAVSCAIATQEKLLSQDVLSVRMGLHIGDVTHADGDVFGDGVNIAARLQEIAEPGAIVISETARRSIDGKLATGLNDLGQLELKNIAEPITAFGWSMTAVTDVATALALPDKPSIAVLPFDNMSGDPEQEYFSDGIAEDIITALSRFHQFFVIARNSSFVFKGRAVDVKQAARELGVQYVIEGSVRRAGSRVRITAQLIDAATSNHVWAERYDRELDDIFAVQDEITERVAMAVGPELDSMEIARAQRKNLPELGVWDLLARANWHGLKLTEKDIGTAEELLFKVLKLDPDNASAHALLSGCYATDVLYGWRRPAAESRALALQFGQTAVALDKEDEFAHARLGVSLLLAKRHEEAILRFRSAIRLNPNSSRALGFLGVTLVYMGKGMEWKHQSLLA